jgi:predicted nucleotide-binding protein
MPRVFVAYGSDHKARDDISDVLRSLGLQPVVISKSPDHSKSLIEKFEHAARQCEFAVILLTPDDKKVFGTKLRRVGNRARQNVIFEMGWFFGHLGRTKTLLLRKGVIEMPSDVRGVLYKKYINSPFELRSEIESALRAGGVRIGRRGRR